MQPVHLQYLSIPFISFSSVSFQTQPDHGIDLREKTEQTQRAVYDLHLFHWNLVVRVAMYLAKKTIPYPLRQSVSLVL